MRMSQSELKQCCEELDIDYEEYSSFEEIENAIRKEADRKFNKKWRVSADNISDVLKRFLVYSYDYKILDKEGKEVEV